MRKFKYDKLVRDKIVETQLACGAKPTYWKLRPDELRAALVRKIHEEADELLAAEPGTAAGEIADVQQAVDDLKLLLGVTNEAVEIPGDDKWLSHYLENPDRYPELKV